MQYSITVPVEQKEAFDPILLPSIRVSPTVDVNCGYTWPPCLVTRKIQLQSDSNTYYDVPFCRIMHCEWMSFLSIYVTNICSKCSTVVYFTFNTKMVSAIIQAVKIQVWYSSIVWEILQLIFYVLYLCYLTFYCRWLQNMVFPVKWSKTSSRRPRKGT